VSRAVTRSEKSNLFAKENRKFYRRNPALKIQPINNQYYAETKREQTKLNAALFLNVFGVFRLILTAHNGLVAGSGPAGPTNKIKYVRTTKERLDFGLKNDSISF
jgi:hypothetical protein